MTVPATPPFSPMAFVVGSNHNTPNAASPQHHRHHPYSSLLHRPSSVPFAVPLLHLLPSSSSSRISSSGSNRIRDRTSPYSSCFFAFTKKDEENDLRINKSGSSRSGGGSTDDDDDDYYDGVGEEENDLDDAVAISSASYHNNSTTTTSSPRKRRRNTTSSTSTNDGVSSAFIDNNDSSMYQVITNGDSDNILSTPAELQKTQPPQQISSILLLNIVAIIWGSQHAIIKTVVQDNNSDVAAFTFLRFGLATLIALPYLPGLQDNPLFATFHRQSQQQQQQQQQTEHVTTASSDQRQQQLLLQQKIDTAKAWRWGTELGLWMFLGFSLQAIGLLSTTAQRSGFLLYLNVKFVPFFANVLWGRHISTLTWLSALTAFSGTALLALDGQSSMGLNIGDAWSVLAAMASAMFILRLETAAVQVPKSSQLNAASLLVVAVLSGCWLLGQGAVGHTDLSATLMNLKDTLLSHPIELLYLGAISTALSNFLQAKAQKDVPAERASVIYSLDPVYGALFSFLILGETLGGMQSYLGASMIFGAAATNSFLEFSSKQDQQEKSSKVAHDND